MKKPMQAPTHRALMRHHFKNKALQAKIQSGVQRLKVISQIVALRKQLGITQMELAIRVGVSQPFIAKIENDEASNLSLETLLKIVNALNGDIEIQIHPSKKAA